MLLNTRYHQIITFTNESIWSNDYLILQVGERIRVILDCDDNTLAFERNYEFLGVAFRGLPEKLLYPSVSAVYGHTEVSMVYLGPPLDG